MKKVTFIVAAAFTAVIYFGTTSQTVVASNNEGVLTDTSKKKTEAKPVSISTEKSTDSTKAVK